MKNVKFAYLYRDAGNYKEWATVVFSNPAHLTPSAITSDLKRAFLPDGLFIAHQICVPEVLPYGNLTLDDHCFHEFDSVELTTDPPNDRLERSIGEFLIDVTREAMAGWRAFDPSDRSHSLENVQPSGQG
jgi:hypothetical protein